MVVNGKELLKAAPMKEMFAGKHSAYGVSYGLGEVGYDIRIKQAVNFVRTDRGERIVITAEREGDGELRQYNRARGNFIIASAMEEFVMPEDLMGIVHDKSTWARQGLSVFNTVIEPGWKGFLTLELVYHGGDCLEIPAGAGIAQVVFHKLSSVARYEGKYQHQADRPVEAISSK